MFLDTKRATKNGTTPASSWAPPEATGSLEETNGAALLERQPSSSKEDIQGEDSVNLSDPPERLLRQDSRATRATRGVAQKYDQFFVNFSPDTEETGDEEEGDGMTEESGERKENITLDSEEEKGKKRRRVLKQLEELEAKARGGSAKSDAKDEAKKKKELEKEKTLEEWHQKKVEQEREKEAKKKVLAAIKDPTEALKEMIVVMDTNLLYGAGLQLYQKLIDRGQVTVQADNLSIPKVIQFKKKPPPADLPKVEVLDDDNHEGRRGRQSAGASFENVVLIWEELASFKQKIVDGSIKAFVKTLGTKMAGKKIIFLLDETSQSAENTGVTPQDLEKNLVAMQFEMGCKISRSKSTEESAYLIEVMAKSIATVPDL